MLKLVVMNRLNNEETNKFLSDNITNYHALNEISACLIKVPVQSECTSEIGNQDLIEMLNYSVVGHGVLNEEILDET